MSEIRIVEHENIPYFDLEEFMVMSQESRIGGATLERLSRLWEEWLPLLKTREIVAGKMSWLAVWLPESVEEAADAAWERSPSDGWQENNLAQFMCMAAVREMIPQVEAAGCAPAPRPSEALRGALEELGLRYKEDSPTLERRFAVVTHYPFRGGCEICHLQSQCPKGQGRSEEASVLLPGFERGRDQDG